MDVNDLVMLDDLNEAMILHCLRDRFSRDQIYTWVGCVSAAARRHCVLHVTR